MQYHNAISSPVRIDEELTDFQQQKMKTRLVLGLSSNLNFLKNQLRPPELERASLIDQLFLLGHIICLNLKSFCI